MSNVINERPLMVLPSLATSIGLEKAVVMQQLHLGYPATPETFPWLTQPQIDKIVSSLGKPEPKAQPKVVAPVSELTDEEKELLGEEPKARHTSQTGSLKKRIISPTLIENDFGDEDNDQPRQRKDRPQHSSLRKGRSREGNTFKGIRSATQIKGKVQAVKVHSLDELIEQYADCSWAANVKSPPELNNFWKAADSLRSGGFSLGLSQKELAMLNHLVKGMENWQEILGTVIVQWDKFLDFCMKDGVWENHLESAPTVEFILGKGKSRIMPFILSKKPVDATTGKKKRVLRSNADEFL